MNRRNQIIVAGSAAVAVVALVAIGMNVAGASTGSAPIVPSGSPTPSGSAALAPAPTSSAPAGTDPQAPATLDPDFGDVVVATATAESASFASGLTVELVSVTDTTASSSGVGATGGAAIEVSLLVTNTTSATIDLSPVVNAYVGADRVPLTPDHESAIASSIAASAQSSGSYTFAIDDPSSVIWITVGTSSDSGLVVFEYSR